MTSAISLLSFVAIASATYCPPTWGYNNPPTDETLQSSTVTITVPGVSGQIAGSNLALFNGVLSDGGFIQPLIATGPDTYCGVENGADWCASAIRYDSSDNPVQINGTPVSVPVGTELVLAVNYDNDGNITQTVSSTSGDVLSILQTPSDAGNSIALSMEWQGDFTATMPAVTWSNLTLVFNTPVPDLPSMLQVSNAAASDPTTPDGGTTWNVASIQFDSTSCAANS